MPKEDCKYWDKCYQTNEQHLSKYNHPPKLTNERQELEGAAAAVAASTTAKTTTMAEAATNAVVVDAQKRKASTDLDTNNDAAVDDYDKAPYDITELRKEALANISGKNYMQLLQKRIKLSMQSEYDDLLRSNEFIRHKFLVEMPPDFYAFWKFACELKPNATGEQVLQHFEQQFKLQLVAPFEFLAGRFHNATIREPGDYLRHWRFFYDPPEFQTIFVKRGTGVHYGYWRDEPHEKDNLLVARNDRVKGCEFEFVAGNAFDAFLHYLSKDYAATPFTAALLANTKKQLQKFLSDNEVQVENMETLKRARAPNVNAKTFHTAGIVVPYDRKLQLGYRPLMVSDAELKKILKLFETAGQQDGDDTVKTAVMEKLQPICTAANIAMDESDFGTCLELGIDLFCSGRYELQMLAQSLLVPAYTLLQRPQYIAISKAHLDKRSKDLQLSIFDLDKSEQTQKAS